MINTDIHLHRWYYSTGLFFWIFDILPSGSPDDDGARLMVKFFIMHFESEKEFKVYPFEEVEYLDILAEECARDVTDMMMCSIVYIEPHTLDYVKI
jgi:hypothetical protein